MSNPESKDAKKLKCKEKKMKAEMAEEQFTPFPHFSTLAIHAGQDPRQWNSRAVVPPISLATTFQQDEPGVFLVRNKRSFFKF